MPPDWRHFYMKLARFELVSGQNVYKLSTCLVVTWFSNGNRRYYLPIAILVSEFHAAGETTALLFRFDDAQSNSIGQTISRSKGRA